MTIIELLDKMANNEEMPKEIIWMGKSYFYEPDFYDYSSDDKYDFTYFLFKQIFNSSNNHLNDEIEIIEEHKIIEPLKVKSSYTKNQKRIVAKMNEIIKFINETRRTTK